jgi:hypothetical protein
MRRVIERATICGADESMTGGIIWQSSSASPEPCATARPSPSCPAFRQLQSHLLRKPGGDREMVDILPLVLHHDEQAC